MKRAGILALAALLAVAGITAIAACIVPPHRFGDPPPIDAPPMQEDAAPPPAVVAIPSGVSIQGTYAAADSQPIHQVYTSGFEITQGCVSEGAYQSCVNAGSCPPAPDDGGQIGLGGVGIEHASTYCAFIGMRVPTEAELERAMRGDMGATTISAPTPHGVGTCSDFDNGNVMVVVSDRYTCDAYVGRPWANPLEDDGSSPPHERLFRFGATPQAIPPRSERTPFPGIRCARTIDTAAPPASPVQPTCAANCEPTSLALGERFGCARRSDGSVWCWGSNEHGALGTGDIFDAMPAATARPAIATGIAEVVAGARFACARASGGTVSCWGDNTAGQIGDGTTDTARSPTQLVTSVLDLAVAGEHGCVIRGDTTVHCWGRGGANPAGTGATSPTAIGITGATAIAAGARSECVINGTSIQCWGVIHDNAGTLGYIAPASARTFPFGGAPTALAIGDGHGCAVVGTDVHCWGDRTHWGGTGVATSPEAVTSTTVAPQIYATDTGTLIVDQGVIVLDVNVALPTTIAFDGDSFAFTPGAAERSGCVTSGTGVTCFGVEHGQLGRSNGCDVTPATTALALP